MAIARYVFTMKSEEQEGASQPNIIEIGLDDGGGDADALVFAGNLEVLFAAHVVSIVKLSALNYALPYPLGTKRSLRLAIRNATLQLQSETLFDVKLVADGGPDITAVGAAYVAAGVFVVVPPAAGSATWAVVDSVEAYETSQSRTR